MAPAAAVSQFVMDEPPHRQPGGPAARRCRCRCALRRVGDYRFGFAAKVSQALT